MRKLSLQELERLGYEEFKKAEKLPLVVVLDNVRSMHNVGAVFRTCDAFRVERIILSGITATPPDKEITKTAIGATDSVEWNYEKDCRNALKELKSNRYHLLAVEQCENSLQLDEYRPLHDKTAIVLGNEINGVQQKVVDLCDQCLAIPQFGTKHSLNISVSAGVVIWDIFRKQKELWAGW